MILIFVMKIASFRYNAATVACPVDHVKVDENRVRFVAFFVLALIAVYILTGNPLLLCLLLADFLLRAFNLNSYSPLALLSGTVVKQIGLKNKPVDRAPKRFAAFMGLSFIAIILAVWLLNFTLLAKSIAVLVAVFASLESFFGFCAGCYVYTFINRFKKTA